MFRSLRPILFGPRIRVPEEVRSQLGPADVAASDDAEAKLKIAVEALKQIADSKFTFREDVDDAARIARAALNAIEGKKP